MSVLVLLDKVNELLSELKDSFSGNLSDKGLVV